MSNLRLINETEITSTVTSVNVEDVFTADFDVYKIVCTIKESAAGQQQYARLRFINSSGSVITSSNYDYAQHKVLAGGTEVENRSTTADNLLYFGNPFTEDTGGTSTIYVFNPYSSSEYSFVMGQGSYTSSGSLQVVKGIGVYHQAETVTGFQFYQSSGSMGSGSIIRTYGLRVDS